MSSRFIKRVRTAEYAQKERRTFRPTAHMEGNVETKGISAESGAVLMGNIKM